MKKTLLGILIGILAGLTYRIWGGLAGVGFATILLLLWLCAEFYYRRQLATLCKILDNMDDKERLELFSHAGPALKKDLSARFMVYSHDNRREMDESNNRVQRTRHKVSGPLTRDVRRGNYKWI